MRRGLSVLSLWILCWLAPSAPAWAQDHQGFWVGLGGGFGSAGISCDECEDSDREGSGVGYLRGGWGLSDQLLVGVDFRIWSKSADVEPGTDVTINLYNVMGSVTYYPQPATPFFVTGGLGASVIDTEIDFDSSSLSADLGTGFGVVVGAGYDIRLTDRLSLTPAVNFWYGQPGDLKVGVQPLFSDWSQNVIDFTVGITFF
jgi:hypothetical protein